MSLSTITPDQGVDEAVQTNDVVVIRSDGTDRLRWILLQDFLMPCIAFIWRTNVAELQACTNDTAKYAKF